MNNPLKFTTSPTTSELEESWGDSVPSSAQFYWKMLPPKRSMFKEYQGAASDYKRKSGFGPAPRLSPITAAGGNPSKLNTNAATGPSTHVNVRDLHHWTESPVTSRREVPVLNLKEYEILSNPMLNQLSNNVMAFGSSAADTYEKLKGTFDAVKGIGFSWDKASKELENISKMVDGTKASPANMQHETAYADPMNPYQYMYTVLATGFKYSLPYMENEYQHVMSDFSMNAAARQGTWTTALNKLAEAGNEILQTANFNRLLAPGRLIEKPKAFNFEGREKSYTVSFPLLNTKSYVEIIKNWQYIFLMAYQNTPNRINKDLIDPPCIYESYIPGVWYSKYSCISDMRVDFLGARREMELPIMFLDSAGARTGEDGNANWLPTKKKLLTVIPDAYQVSITITELFSETQNSKYQLLRESMNDKIRTGTT